MKKTNTFLKVNLCFYIFLVSIMTLLNLHIYSQTFCITQASSEFSEHDGSVQLKNEQGPFYLRIYVHVVRLSNGTGGQSVNDVYEAISFLDQDFNPHNIFFIWDCEIAYIDDDNLYNNPSAAIFNVGSNYDGIDVYLFRDNPPPNANGYGQAQGIGSIAFFVFGNFWNPPYGSLVKSHVISHEMGHCLNLWHPWQGPNGCLEFVNGTNCEICGDLVCDTPAEPGLNFNVDPESCEWTQSGNDPNGDPYDPDELLIMGYTLPDCMEYFTVGQGQRMRNSISELPLLQNCLLPSINPFITSTELWDNPLIVGGEIVIAEGGHLTITNTISFFPQSKIIVKPGGKLTVNGGVLTTVCYTKLPWQGIEVWGDKNLHQWPDAQGNYSQGRITLNDAIIENAINAVSLWKPGDYSKTGGIISATNTVFRNNTRAIHALHYTNYNPFNGTEMDYQASFTRCTFELDENYPGIEKFYKHVDLSRVRGIRFRACDFSLSSDATNVSKWNMGIGAYSAGFSVNGICTSTSIPCNQWDYSTFAGFTYGINAPKTIETIRTFSINKTVFNNNVNGIRSSGINNIIVRNSEFLIGQNTDEKSECINASGYGIHLTNSTGFAIEENTFSKATGVPPDLYTGIYIEQTEGHDEVYRNSFEGLSFANYAIEKNWTQNTWKGLAYFCNENTLNYADFYVGDLDGTGINGMQGSLTMPAGNTFSQTGATWHFYNGGDYQIGYYYCDFCPGQNPDDDKLYHVTKQGISVQNPCPSHYGGDIRVVKDQQEEDAIASMYATSLSDYNNVKTLYNNLQDGGNTDLTLNELSTTTSANMWERRAQLLGYSPHLSEDVLKAVADKADVFPESVIFEILAANPDELRKDELLEYLEQNESPLPGYMIDILRQVAGGVTYKTVLQQQMAKHHYEKARAAHDMIRSYLNDTIVDMNQVRNWLDNLGGLAADRQIIATFMHEDNHPAALSLANMLPGLYDLQGLELDDHNNYVALLMLEIALHTDGRQLYDLTQTEKDLILQIADAENGSSAVKARNILVAYHDEQFINCPETEGVQAYKRGSVNPNDIAGALGFGISVKPNPAGDWAAFDYILPGEGTSAVLTITDAQGRVVDSFRLSGNQGQKVWDTRNVLSGSYFFKIESSGFTKTGKFVIIR